MYTEYLSFSLLIINVCVVYFGFLWIRRREKKLYQDDSDRFESQLMELKRMTELLERREYTRDNNSETSEIKSEFRQSARAIYDINKEFLDDFLQNLKEEMFLLKQDFRKEFQIEYNFRARNFFVENAGSYDRITPDNMPPVGGIDRLRSFDRADLLKFLLLDVNETEYKAYYWSKRLMNEVDDLQLERAIPGLKYLSFGFFSEAMESKSSAYESEMIFGVIVHVEASEGDSFLSYNKSPIPIQVGEHRFPIVIRGIAETLHCTNPSPLHGTGSCIAISKVGTVPIGPGILTAKHVTGNILGQRIELSCGGHGLVADIGPEGIDAALVICDGCDTNQGSRLQPLELIAPYMQVQFEGNHSGLVRTRVTSITDSKGIYNHFQLPVRVFLGSGGTYGDSGALITDLSGKQAIGIYMGDYRDSAGGAGGIGQHAFQVTETMDMHLYNVK